MKRSLISASLLAMLVLFSFAGSAGAKTTTLGDLIRISGNTAFSHPSKGKVLLTDLKSGKRRSLKTPAGVIASDVDARVNGRALAAVSGIGDGVKQLWVAGLGIKSRILFETIADDGSCGTPDRVVALQIDKENVVTALTTNQRDVPSGCWPDVAATHVFRFAPGGTQTEIALPDEVRRALGTDPNPVALRGDDLMIPPAAAVGGEAQIFNLKTGGVSWNGALPRSADDYVLPGGNLIVSSMDYFGHSSRVYVLNYATNKLKTLTIPHPRAGVLCGNLWVFLGLHRTEVYNLAGHRLFARNIAGHGTYYSGYPAAQCSRNWIYRARSKAIRAGKSSTLRPELINIAHLH